MADRRKRGVSPELDRLATRLMGDAFDLLAEDGSLDVLLVVEDASGVDASYAYCDDGVEECLAGARKKVKSLDDEGGDPEVGLASPVRYAIVYLGAVADDDDVYQDAVILEYGERGYESFAGFSYVDGIGKGDAFAWTDPAPAGQLEPLL